MERKAFGVLETHLKRFERVPIQLGHQSKRTAAWCKPLRWETVKFNVSAQCFGSATECSVFGGVSKRECVKERESVKGRWSVKERERAQELERARERVVQEYPRGESAAGSIDSAGAKGISEIEENSLRY
eukprot:271303-Pleurochrysis_carterae.AAC.1